MGLARTTVNTYLRQKNGSSRNTDSINTCGRMQAVGFSNDDIADLLGVRLQTVVTNLVRFHNKTKRPCEECGKMGILEKPFRGRRLCPGCLSPDYKPTLERSMAYGNIATGGSFENGNVV